MRMLIRTIRLKDLIIITAMIIGIIILAAQTITAAPHPVEITGKPVCSECHNDSRSALDHSGDFMKRHRFYMSQKERVCMSCHKESFCADCHANKEEIKPSDKFKDSPERIFPHRGDYISRHKIDGRINPAPCFKCHGRKNNARCKQCHRR